jgi:hypothetical protein
MKEIKPPKYHNEAILIHCMKREPHSLIFDEDFINYDEKTILELCEDLEKNYQYLCLLARRNASVGLLITMAQSLVWGALYHHHNEITEKYKELKNLKQ